MYSLERLRAALRQTYDDDPHINEISSADLLGEYPAVRYYPPTGDLYFDVLTRLGETASFETVAAEIKEIKGTKVRVATPMALYRLKEGTIRVQDHLGCGRITRALSSERLRSKMRVQKFRSIEEMNRALVIESQTLPFERFLRHCARWWSIAPKHYPRGRLQISNYRRSASGS